MTRRGLTILETLLGLSLLAAMTGTVATWTRIAADLSGERTRELRWEQAATSALDCIALDLKSGDVEHRTVASSTQAKVLQQGDRLAIQTRDTGPDIAWYQLDGRTLTRATDSDQRVLLGETAEFVILLDSDTGWLTVTLQSESGRTVSRSLDIAGKVIP